MNWLLRHYNLTHEPLAEPRVDCANCRVIPPLTRALKYSPTLKCCQFTPFWSGFAIGAWLEPGRDLRRKIAPESSPVLTVFGIMHEPALRREKDSLCQFFDRRKNHCGIWDERPGTCFSFYCASQYKKGIGYYTDLEDRLLELEAEIIKRWFMETVGSESLWDRWVQYMEEWAPLDELPEALTLSTLEQAENHYKEQYIWLKRQGRDPEVEVAAHALAKQLADQASLW